MFSDTVGRYHIDSLLPGKYLLTVSKMGYESQQDTIQLTSKSLSYLWDCILTPMSLQLDEVVVTAKTPAMEMANGKLVLHLEKSALTGGQNALDLLKKLPGINVDQNEDILFKGSAGINVMINGKMTYLSGNQLSNYLKGWNAEDIASVELIANPSSDFDAAGNSGIINIITKKKKKPGYALDLRSVISKAKYWMVNENISASLTSSKLSLYTSLDYNTPHSFYQNQSGNTLLKGTDQLMLSRSNEYHYKIKYYTWRFGADWQWHPKQKIGINYHGYFDDFRSNNYSTINTLRSTGDIQSYIKSDNILKEPYHYDALNLNYQFDIDSTGKKITADAHYTIYRNYSDGLLSSRYFDTADNLIGDNKLISHQPGSVKIRSMKTDIEWPLKEISLKGGVKYAQVDNDNNYRFDSIVGGVQTAIPEMTNHFMYKEQIFATYVTAGKQYQRTRLNAGLRFEHTQARGYTAVEDVANYWKYSQLFPSFSIEQRLNNQQALNISVSRRINRPAYTHLNPVRWYTDQYFYFAGNPKLLPELAWIYTVQYSISKKYIFAVNYNSSQHFINRRLEIDNNGVTIRSQSANFSNRQRLDLSIVLPVTIFSIWDVQLLSNTYYTTYPIAMRNNERRLSQWSQTLTLLQEITLPKAYKVDIGAYYYSTDLRGIYVTRPNYYIDIGGRKSFYNNRLHIKLTVGDIFNTNRYIATSQTDVTDYHYNDKPDSRRFSLSVAYQLGGSLFKANSDKTEEQQRL